MNEVPSELCNTNYIELLTQTETNEIYTLIKEENK